VADSEEDEEPENAVSPTVTESRAYCRLETVGRTIVDFTQEGEKYVKDLLVYANKDLRAARTDGESVFLTAGTYEVQLGSFRPSTTTRASKETWYAVLFGNDGKEVAVTKPASDVPDWWEDKPYASGRTTLVLNKDVYNVRGVHAVYGDVLGNPVAPLCVSFKRILTATSSPTGAEVTAPTATDTTQAPPPTHTAPVIPPPSDTTAISPTVTVRLAEDLAGDASSTAKFSPEHWTTVPPDSIGIPSISRETVVPRVFVERRTLITQELQQSPLEVLERATPREREVLFFKLIQDELDRQRATGTDNVPVGVPARLVRRSYDADESRVPVSGEESQTTSETANPTRIGAEIITHRAGLIALRDSDGDGVTDYDEEHIYGTDPENPFTAGSVFSDGERVILGLDPTTDGAEPVIVESPRRTGTATPDIFGIASIDRVAGASTTRDGAEVVPGIRITGTGPAYSFITLYVYSTPIIITVRTDAAGTFEYTFEETLEDGSHEIYVTTVNNSGKILAKSEPIPFIKTAQAIEYTPASTLNADPVRMSMQRMITFGFFAALLVALSGIVWIGMYRVRRGDGAQPRLESNEQQTI
jgi:hypothetical protein